jgi:hypothetical protein
MFQQKEKTKVGSDPQEEGETKERQPSYKGQGFEETQKRKEGLLYQQEHKFQPGYQQQRIGKGNQQPQDSQYKKLFQRDVNAKRQPYEPQPQIFEHPKQKLEFPSKTQCQTQSVKQEDNPRHQTELNRRLGHEMEYINTLEYQIQLSEQVQDQNRKREEFELEYLEDSVNLMTMSENHSFHQIQSQTLLQYQSGVNPQTNQVLPHLQSDDGRPEMPGTDSQPLYLAAQTDSRSQGLLMNLDWDPNELTLCPMATLPSRPCSWAGSRSCRAQHIMMNHSINFSTSNYIALSSNKSAILNVYTEYFLCYTITCYKPKKLYCIAQHSCESRNCVLTYQYTCEIRAANGYEKISHTRLVGHFADDFGSLTKLGRCARFDNEVVNYFAGNSEPYVTFTISIPEPV